MGRRWNYIKPVTALEYEKEHSTISSADASYILRLRQRSKILYWMVKVESKSSSKI